MGNPSGAALAAQGDGVGAAPQTPRHVYRRRVRLVAWVVYALLLLALAEGLSLAMWVRLAGGWNFTRQSVQYNFFGNLRPVIEARPTRDDGCLNVLLLGGSVLAAGMSDIPELLHERLSAISDEPVRIHNPARPAFTSLDSLYQYRALKDCWFDVVVVYHGINGAMMNNCPPGGFRDDYSHNRRYRRLRNLDLHPARRILTLPYTAAWLWTTGRQWLDDPPLMPRNSGDWHNYGGDIRTPAPFRRNVQHIVELAAQRGQAVVLCTFAFYIAQDYTEPRFLAGELDYTNPGSPISTWGLPQNVARTIDAHNEQVRRLAAEHDLPLVDHGAAFPRRGELFRDICHFTRRGAQQWVDDAAPTIVTQAAAQRAADQPRPAVASKR